MCKRSEAAKDPLLNLFLQRYQLNLLSVPRASADVGDLYVHDGARAGSPGRIDAFLEKPLAMPEATRGEALAGLDGTTSNGVSIDAGAGLLGSFLAGFGVPLPIGDVKAKWQAKGARHARFRIEAARRDSVDPGRLGTALIGNGLRADHPLVDAKSRYYLVTAVARCKALTIAFEDERGQAVDLGVDVPLAGNAQAGVDVARAGTGSITVSGPNELAFGVELYELYVRDQRIRLRLPDGAITIRSAHGAATAPRPALIGGDDADVFIDLPPT